MITTALKSIEWNIIGIKFASFFLVYQDKKPKENEIKSNLKRTKERI